MAQYYGYNPPFLGGPNGVLSRQEDEQLIKNDLRALILTRPGERVYRPDFGTILRASLFEPLTPNLSWDIQLDIQQKIARYEERVTVNYVKVTQDADNQRVNVAVSVSPVYNPLVNYLVEVDLPTGGG